MVRQPVRFPLKNSNTVFRTNAYGEYEFLDKTRSVCLTMVWRKISCCYLRSKHLSQLELPVIPVAVIDRNLNGLCDWHPLRNLLLVFCKPSQGQTNIEIVEYPFFPRTLAVFSLAVWLCSKICWLQLNTASSGCVLAVFWMQSKRSQRAGSNWHAARLN